MALDFEPNAAEAGRTGRAPPSGDGPRPGRAYPPSAAADWSPILTRLGVTPDEADAVAARARATGVAFQTELLTSGLVGEAALFSALATELGLKFVANINPETLVAREQDCLRALRQRGGIRIVRAVADSKETIHLLAPDRLNIPSMRGYLRRYPEIAECLRITTPSALRAAMLQQARPALQRAACEGLFEYLPSCSARIVATARQGAFIGAFLVALPVCLSLALSLTTIVTHCVSSLFFLSCVALRMAVSGSGPGPLRQPRLEAIRPREMPVYTVLVALYKEAAIIPDLMVALGRIVWPRSKIEIKLVCEADDSETLAAIRAQKLRPWVEVIEVPPEGPRTKPKALSYALPTTSGDFVVLYDAEDKPHPLQLVEAWQRFREAGEDLACLQAPLFISNGRENRLAALFALEYSALFRGLLPWLARRQVVLPLGGTSNHFRGIR